MTISLVQTSAASTSGATSLSNTPGAATTAGNLLILSIVDVDGTTAPTISDTAGNTWTSAGVSLEYTYPRQALIYYCSDAASISSVTITPSSSQIIYAQLYEVSGCATVSPLDVAISASGSSAAPTATTGTTTDASEFTVGLFANNAPLAGLSGVTSGWTTQAEIHPASSAGLYPAYRILSATGAVTLAGTWSASVAWGVLIATFKAGAGPATANPIVMVV